MERQTLAWLHRLVYKNSKDFYQRHIQDERIALGNITSGGTLGNLTAMSVAREKALPGIRKIAARGKIRFHVDPAWGGTLLLSEILEEQKTIGNEVISDLSIRLP